MPARRWSLGSCDEPRSVPTHPFNRSSTASGLLPPPVVLTHLPRCQADQAGGDQMLAPTIGFILPPFCRVRSRQLI
jgi:hypothetical protein